MRFIKQNVIDFKQNVVGFKQSVVDKVLSDLSLGIEFKPNHLILTLLRKTFRKMTLVDSEMQPLPSEGQREEREVQILNLINKFISKHHLQKEKTSVSIPREKSVVRFIRLPIATKENLRKVIEYEIPKYTPFEKGEVYFDCQILKEEKDWLHLYAVFIKKTEVDPYLSVLKKIGIEPISVQIPSVGALNLFYYHEGAKENEISVLLDVAESFFEMDLIRGKEWQESFYLPLPREKRESRIRYTFERSVVKEDSLPKATFFVHGLDVDEKLLNVLKEDDRIKGVSLPPLNRIEMDPGRLPSLQKNYASVGVPLKGLIKTQVDLNLLPFEMRRKVREFGRPLSVLLTAVALFLALTWGAGLYYRYSKELATLSTEINRRRPEVEAVEKLQKQKEELGKEIFELQKIRSDETSKIEILKELTQILPNTVWIWSFKYNGKEVEINGFADSASDLIPLLDKSPFFEKVEFLAPVTKERQMRSDGDKEKERFRIKAKVEGRRA
jgi:general secretion pathway protein L